MRCARPHAACRASSTRSATTSTAYAHLDSSNDKVNIVQNTGYVSLDDPREPWGAWVAAPAASSQAAQVALRAAWLGDGSYCFRKSSQGLVLCVLHIRLTSGSSSTELAAAQWRCWTCRP